MDAEAWLVAQERTISRGEWQPPAPVARESQPAPPTLSQYAATVVGRRRLRPATEALYAKLLRLAIVPAFGNRQLADITVADVTAWYRSMSATPTQQANAYGLLKSILKDVARDGRVGCGQRPRILPTEWIVHGSVPILDGFWGGMFAAVRALMGQLVRAVLRAIDAETGLLAWGQPVRRTDRSAPKVGSSLRLRGLAGSRAQSVGSFTGEVFEGGGASGEEEQECSYGAGDVGPVAAGPVGIGCCELIALNR